MWSVFTFWLIKKSFSFVLLSFIRIYLGLIHFVYADLGLFALLNLRATMFYQLHYFFEY